jgi:putative ABC transport system permease protein
VVSTGFTLDPPLGLDDYSRIAFVPEGFEMPRDRENFTSTMDIIDEGFFNTMGIPVLRGRGFQASDTADTPRVAVVNEQFAKHYWPGANSAQSAVGKRIRLDRRTGTPVEIIGVAKTIAYRDSNERPMDFVYLPRAQHPMARMVLLLRSAGDPLHLAGPLEDVVRGLDPNMPISELRSYDDLYRYNTVEGPRVAIDLVGTMSGVALLLAIAGLYGLMAYNVSRRTREIGIRMAIGATPGDALRLVMGQGLTLVGIGTATGLAMGMGMEQAMNAMLFNAGGVDIVAYLAVVPSMFLATVAATWAPARRASRIAATQALRYE